MIRKLKFVLLAACIASSTIASSQDADRARDAAQFIETALKVVQEIKPGETRAELERNFTLDGGLQFSKESSRYVYKACSLIKIDVKFTVSPGSSGPEPAPTDRIDRVSKPYLEYPFAD